MSTLSRYMPKLRPELEPECLTLCVSWASVWFALARAARLAGEWDMAERFTSAGEQAFEALEAMR